AVRAGAAHRVADLLLVHPELAVLAGDIEPYRGRLARRRPRHRLPGRAEIRRLPQLVQLRAQVVEQIDQGARLTYRAVSTNPWFILARNWGRLSPGSGSGPACRSGVRDSFLR